MKFVSLSKITKNKIFFIVAFTCLILLNSYSTKKPEKNETDKLKEKINTTAKKTPFEKMLKNIEFVEIEKDQKFSVAKRDIKVLLN